MAMTTLKDLVVSYAGEQATAAMDDLQKQSTIIATASAITASNGLYHLGRKVTALPTASFSAPGEAVTSTSMSSDVVQSDVIPLMCLLEVPKHIADAYKTRTESSPVAQWFADNYMTAYESIGQKIGKVSVYGTDGTFGDAKGFKGLHYYAKSSSNLEQMGGTTGSRCSIFAVKWNPSYNTFITGNNIGMGGMPIKMTPCYGGTPYINPDKVYVYGMICELPIGLYNASNTSVAAMTQIDSTHLPTAVKMQSIIDKVKGSPSDTVIYCTRQGRAYLSTLMDGKRQLFSADRNYPFSIGQFDGFPVIIEDNMVNTETTALD